MNQPLKIIRFAIQVEDTHQDQEREINRAKWMKILQWIDEEVEIEDCQPVRQLPID